MRRWIWRVLLMAAAVLALTGTALAADPVTLDNGVVLTQEGSGWKITGYTGSGGRVVIPSQYSGNAISVIGEGAFTGTKISEVIIPANITEIGASAFEKCQSLKTAVFLERSGTAPKLTIQEKAFLNCGNLENIMFSEGLGTIGSRAFSGAGELTALVIPDKVTSIGELAFAQCTKLKTVYIPASLKPAGSTAAKPISKTTFSSTTLESIHYGGSVKGDVFSIFEALPPGFNGAVSTKVHLATNDRVISEPTCVDDGKVLGGVACDEAGDTKTEVCSSLGKGLSLTALGHDYQEPEVEMGSHKDCETWTWEYTVTCSRCGAEVERKKVITATADHTWVDDGTATITKPATCKEEGEKTTPQKCSVCGQAGEPKKESIPKLATHTYTKGATETYVIRPGSCSGKPENQGFSAVYKVCDVCGKTSACEADCVTLKTALEEARKGSDQTAITDAENALKTHLETSHKDDVTIEPADQLTHTKPEETEPDPALSKPATCEEDGKNVYNYTCAVCSEAITGEEEVLTKLGHEMSKGEDVIIREATCTTPGEKKTGITVCKRPGCGHTEGGEIVTDPAKGHDWGEFDTDQDMTPNETCVEKTVTGTISCKRCSEKEERTLTIEGLSSHNYKGSEWKIVKEPTATEEGLRQRPCMNPGCTHMDEEILPATGEPEDPDDPDDPEDPDDPDEPDEPSKPEEPKSYQVTTVQGAGGTASANRTTARAGDRITITVSPSSGYELDMVRVIASNGKVPQLESLGGGQYRFTMPEANVEIRATFQRKSSGPSWAAAPEDGSTGNPRRTKDVMPTQNPTLDAPQTDASQQLFRDVPMSHWAAGEINWANQMGYMNGTGGRFNPDGVISHQQMWIVLARLTGSNPANMAEARRWAVQGGFADGSAPTGAVKRHQLVTALYRCARLSGSLNQNTTSLAGYTDSRTVPAVARDAFSWALANGIVSGGADKTLNPNGTLTRAQFAVILYRYSQRI